MATNPTVTLTKNQLYAILYDLAKGHYQIKGFGYGDLWELEVATITAFLTGNDLVKKSTNGDRCPLMWITPLRGRVNGTTFFYDFDVIICDLVYKDEGNELEVESDSMEIIKDIIALLDNNAYPWTFQRANIVIDPFTERFQSEWTGHIASMSLQIPFNFNRCQVPTAFVSISNPYIPIDEHGTNEQDPIFKASPAFTITQEDIDRWNEQAEATGSSVFTYQNDTFSGSSIQLNELIGLQAKDIIVFYAGTEMISTPGITFDSSTGTVTFPGDITGILKIWASKPSAAFYTRGGHFTLVEGVNEIIFSPEVPDNNYDITITNIDGIALHLENLLDPSKKFINKFIIETYESSGGGRITFAINKTNT